MAKMFSGKRYQLYGSYNKKLRAKAIAKRFRAGGESARVVRNVGEGQWEVYVRYSRGRG